MRQFEQCEGVAPCFGEDALENALVEGTRKGRTQEGPCVRWAETIDGKIWETVEITGDRSSSL